MTDKKSSNAALIQRRHAVVPRGVGQFAGDTTAASALGAHIVDAEGHTVLDLAGGIGVMNVGHSDPGVVAAIQAQAALLQHACIHVATYEPYIDLCEKLVELFPHGDSTKAMLANSGAEAVENAIKFARQATGRSAVICFSEAFHGRTMLALSLTSKTTYKHGCGPFAPEIYRLPYPDRFHLGQGLSEEEFVARELKRVEHAFGNTVAADQVAAIIIESVQGEGGFIPAPFGYLQGLRQICTDHGIMLICDEVQSGFGRTGAWSAYEHSGIVPDLSTWAKSMGGGLPISAVIGKAEVMDAALPGTIGGTYGGNPIACAAALATIKSMETLDINARAREIGAQVHARFTAMAKQSSWIADIRGIGAMIGVEFCHDGDPEQPSRESVEAIISHCRKNGVIVIPASRHGNVLRILSPLVISDADLDRALSTIEQAVHALPGKVRS